MATTKKWQVEVHYTEITSYIIEVEAADEDAAIAIAESFDQEKLEEECTESSLECTNISAEYWEELTEDGAN
jgi:hypothetical protein